MNLLLRRWAWRSVAAVGVVLTVLFYAAVGVSITLAMWAVLAWAVTFFTGDWSLARLLAPWTELLIAAALFALAVVISEPIELAIRRCIARSSTL